MAPRGDGVAASVSAAFDAARRAVWPHSRPGASLGERLASARLAGGASSSSSSHANLPSSPGGRSGGRFAPDASEVVDVDAARARREFADGGPAVCRLTSPTGAHGVFATWQPPAPRPGSRVSALTLARETHGARVDIGVGPGAGPSAESSPDRARPDQAAPTDAPDANDPPARSPLLHPGGDGGVSFESNHAFGEGACVAQAQILSNLGGFDDATFAARCTLPERNHRRRNENSWTSRLCDAAWGTSPREDGDGNGDGDGDGSLSAPSTPRASPSPPRVDVTAFGSLHVDSFGDRTVELELRKQAADVPPGARPPFARLVTLAEAFVFDLRGAAPESPSHPRLETVVAGELRRAGKPRARVRGKLTTDLTTRERWFAAEARGDGGAEGGEMTCRVVTDFLGETETRARGERRLRAMCVPGKVETRVVNLATARRRRRGFEPDVAPANGFVDEVSHAVELTTRVANEELDAANDEGDAANKWRLDARCAHEWNPETTRVRRRVGVRARRETRARDGATTTWCVAASFADVPSESEAGAEWRREWRRDGSDSAIERDEGDASVSFVEVRVGTRPGRDPFRAFVEFRK